MVIALRATVVYSIAKVVVGISSITYLYTSLYAIRYTL
jgi:hypothetical protein